MDLTPTRALGPVFVGGTGRSGTTVFARLLGSHRAIFSLRWESQFIVARHGLVELIDADFADPELTTFLELMRGRWFKRTLNAGKLNEYEAGLCDDITPACLEREVERFQQALQERERPGSELAARFVDGLLKEPTARAGAERWCEKTPRNSLYCDRLSELFPDARFINVIRDGRDVACSMAERRFWPIGATHDFPSTNRFRGEVSFEKAIEYWVEMVTLGREVASRLPPNQYLEVRLEDLVHEQESTVRGVLDFLGEPPDSSLVEFRMREAPLGRWREELDADQLRFAESHAGESLAANGYAI